MPRKPLKSSTAPCGTKKDPNRYPKGWDHKKTAAVIAHYENQTESEAAAEDQAAYESTKTTMMAVPVDLVPEVEKLIAKRTG